MPRRALNAGVLLILMTLSFAVSAAAQQVELQGSWCNPPNDNIPYNVNEDCPELAGLVDAAASVWNAVFAFHNLPYRLVRPGVLESQKSCEYTETPPCAVNGNYRKCEFAGVHRNSVDWCRTVNDSGRVTVRGYFGDAAEVPYGIVDQDALAFTVTTIDPNPNPDGLGCCITGADICVLFGFRNCTPIDWHTTLDQPGALTYDMFSVLIHEFGHYLGLGHSTIPTDVMFPTITGGERKVVEVVTRDAIGFLYGVDRPAWPATSVESTTWGRVKGLYR